MKEHGDYGESVVERPDNADFLYYLFKKHVEMRLPALWDYWKPSPLSAICGRGTIALHLSPESMLSIGDQISILEAGRLEARREVAKGKVKSRTIKILRLSFTVFPCVFSRYLTGPRADS